MTISTPAPWLYLINSLLLCRCMQAQERRTHYKWAWWMRERPEKAEAVNKVVKKRNGWRASNDCSNVGGWGGKGWEWTLHLTTESQITYIILPYLASLMLFGGLSHLCRVSPFLLEIWYHRPRQQSIIGQQISNPKVKWHDSVTKFLQMRCFLLPAVNKVHF